MPKQRLTDRQLISGVTLTDLLHFVVTGDTSQSSAGSSYKGNVEQLFDSFSAYTCTNPLTLDVVNACTTGITINGNVVINGSATTINTEVIQSKDNNIVLNYSGTHLTAIGGGITLEDGQSNGVDSRIYTDSNGTWLFDPGLSASTGTIDDFTANTISVTTIGNSGDCVNDLYVSNIHSCSPLNINPLDEGNIYFGSTSGVTIDVANSRLGIGTTTPTEKLDVSGNTKISGSLNIGTILSGTPLVNLGIDSSGNVVTGTTGGVTFTGNTSGDCITDLYVSNLYGCSPITVNDSVQSVTSSATGTTSFAFGFQTTASGPYSHAEGRETTASGYYSHAEGYLTTASGYYSHAEGFQTTTSGYYSHAEGFQTTASGDGSHAEGYQTSATTFFSHAEGFGTIASGFGSHAEGRGNIASGYASHVEGGIYFSGKGVPEVQPTSATTYSSHAEGRKTLASGQASHAEGAFTVASGLDSHSEGFETTASGDYSHAEGRATTASGYGSHAEGFQTTASAYFSHAEGRETNALGDYSHAQGSGTTASGIASFASGINSIAQTDGTFIHSQNSLVTGQRSVVLGGQNITGSTNDTVFVPYLNINNLGTGTSINNLGIDSNGFVVTGTTGGGGGGNTAPITIGWDGQGGFITTGLTRYFVAPYNATITGWSIVAEGTNPTCTIDVWKIASGTALPTVANTITASAIPALSTGNVIRSSTLTGWTTAITAGDILAFNIDAAANALTIKINLEL
jgi:hypothetical protein